ncbi:MAG TPA: DegT/DnrJ/EryC1/StrS family aminotransferase [Stellaceae bacterium]|nr:DegT/DnrJ/EryC1/StrS family aminotransferase [Stellaceae bacterium]
MNDQSDIQPIQFIDLKQQRDRVRDRVEEGWQRVVDHGQYIMGPEVGELERQLAEYTGAAHVVSCSNGTDALWLPLLALNVGPGDAVFLPSWTFTATAEVVCLVGATPVFVDVDGATMNMSPASLASAIRLVRNEGQLRPRAVIPVDLFGLPADYEEINAIAREAGMKVMADAAQAFGATQGNRRVGVLADVTATSFYPAKPLGCWGDGGAIFTDDAELAEAMRSVRIHGRGAHGKYDNTRVGTNARLDTLQAVVLIEKLAIFDDELAERQRVAVRYADGLGRSVTLPSVPQGNASSWALYTIQTDRRAELQQALLSRGIRTEIYYPRPLHEQPPYRHYPVAPGGLPETERLKDEVLSLPMHPYLTAQQSDYVCRAVRAALG